MKVGTFKKEQHSSNCFALLIKNLNNLKMKTNKLRVLWERKKDGSIKRELYFESPSVILFIAFLIAVLAFTWMKTQG